MVFVAIFGSFVSALFACLGALLVAVITDDSWADVFNALCGRAPARQVGNDDEGPVKEHYLWICHRADFTADYFVNEELEKEHLDALDDKVREQIQGVDGNVQEVHQKFEAINQQLDRFSRNSIYQIVLIQDWNSQRSMKRNNCLEAERTENARNTMLCCT